MIAKKLLGKAKDNQTRKAQRQAFHLQTLKGLLELQIDHAVLSSQLFQPVCCQVLL